MTEVAYPACVEWVRAVARRRVDACRARWDARTSAAVHAEIDEILEMTPCAPVADATTETYRVTLDRDARWRAVVDGFALSSLEADLLALLTTVHVDDAFRRVLGYLADEVRLGVVSPAAAGSLFAWPPGAYPGPNCNLVRWCIAAPDDTAPDDAAPWSSTATWHIDADVAGFLCGRDDWHRYWPGIDVRSTAAGPDACVFADLRDEISSTVTALTSARDVGVAIELVGRTGSGRRTLVQQCARELGRGQVVVGPAAVGVRLLRTARLVDGFAAVIADDESVAPVDDGPGAITFVARESADATDTRVVRSWAIPELDRAQRLRLWTKQTEVPPPDVIDRWTLTPSELLRAAHASRGGPALVAAVTRRALGTVSHTLTTPLECPYSWNDLVVADSVMDRLRSLDAQVRTASVVLDEWGFRRLTPTTRGTVALFAGPSGTGKTMSAQVLARSLDLDLYRVDLAQVVNKYIGETEKRLARVFDECERSNVMVLFDEADALFGQRTRVQDAHDRFANIEIDFLLQRMESFDGVAVLATNRKGDIDDAFLRRVRVVVDFLAPTVSERRRLWQLALPGTVRDGVQVYGEIDHDLLAESLHFTGAEIKSTVLSAAFAACASGEPISTTQVLRAASHELAKRGDVLRPDVITRARAGTDGNRAYSTVGGRS